MTMNPVIPLRARIPRWTVAERLRKGRRDAKLSQKELADQLGVKESTYSAWEAGRNNPDILELAPRLEEITGISRLFFIGWADGGDGDGPGGVPGELSEKSRTGNLQGRVISVDFGARIAA